MRIDYGSLPASVRTAVEEHAGPVRESRSVDTGINSALAAILETGSGRVFLKGVTGDDRAAAGHQREVDVNPAVAGAVSPQLLWEAAADGWRLAAYEAAEGHHADYAPGSPDLPEIAATLGALAKIPCPAVPMFSAWRRWGSFLDDPEDARHFAGSALLHTDANPGNYLVGGGRAWLVDWALATRGAAFIDVAIVLPRLIDAGHDVEEAEGWAAQHAVWREADPVAVALFARAFARQLLGFADRNPGDGWRRGLAGAASAWAEFRARVPAV